MGTERMRAFGITGRVWTSSWEAHRRQKHSSYNRSRALNASQTSPRLSLGRKQGCSQVQSTSIFPRQHNAMWRGRVYCIKHCKGGSGAVGGANSTFGVASSWVLFETHLLAIAKGVKQAQKQTRNLQCEIVRRIGVYRELCLEKCYTQAVESLHKENSSERVHWKQGQELTSDVNGHFWACSWLGPDHETKRVT